MDTFQRDLSYSKCVQQNAVETNQIQDSKLQLVGCLIGLTLTCDFSTLKFQQPNPALQQSQVSQQSLLTSGAAGLMSTATSGLGQNAEGMVTSVQTSVAQPNIGITFSGVNTGTHNMSVRSMDQQDNAAVSTNIVTAGSFKIYFTRKTKSSCIVPLSVKCRISKTNLIVLVNIC